MTCTDLGFPARGLEPSDAETLETDHPGDPVADMALYLRNLRDGAGRPPFREMAAQSHCCRSSLADAATGRVCPTRVVARAFAEACRADAVQLRVLENLWDRARRADVAARSHQARQRRGRSSIREASLELRRHGTRDNEAPDPFQPVPPIGGTAVQFNRSLRALHTWADKPGPKDIIQRTGKRLSSSTMYGALNAARSQLPSLRVTQIIVTACAPEAVAEWIKAWRAIKMRRSSSATIPSWLPPRAVAAHGPEKQPGSTRKPGSRCPQTVCVGPGQPIRQVLPARRAGGRAA